MLAHTAILPIFPKCVTSKEIELDSSGTKKEILSENVDRRSFCVLNTGESPVYISVTDEHPTWVCKPNDHFQSPIPTYVGKLYAWSIDYKTKIVVTEFFVKE